LIDSKTFHIWEMLFRIPESMIQILKLIDRCYLFNINQGKSIDRITGLPMNNQKG